MAVSLVAGRRVGRLLRAEFGETYIEDLPLPYFCVSANLTTGQAEIHRRGLVWLWLRASAAIPGILAPVVTQAQVHVDGATINNLPVDIMRETLHGTVVVDAGADRMLETGIEMTEAPSAWHLGAWLRRRPASINNGSASPCSIGAPSSTLSSSAIVTRVKHSRRTSLSSPGVLASVRRLQRAQEVDQVPSILGGRSERRNCMRLPAVTRAHRPRPTPCTTRTASAATGLDSALSFSRAGRESGSPRRWTSS